MIACLRGTVLEAGINSAVVEVAGVGYHVLVPPGTAAILRPGETHTLYTTLVVREDSLTLYGFATSTQRAAFEVAQAASGVGPKLALAIVSVLSPSEFRAAVLREDLPRLRKVPGLGPKGAQKLVIELKDKVAALADDDVAAVPETSAEDLWRAQVSDGLQGLGWSAKDAETACDNVAHLVDEDPHIPMAKLLRAALNTLARR